MGFFDKLKNSDEKTKSKARGIIESGSHPLYGGMVAAAYTGEDYDPKDTLKTYERYGIDPSDYASSGQISQGRAYGKKDSREMHAELRRRANNDYHANEAIKAAALRGDERAQEFAKNGVNDVYQMGKREELLADLHRENGHMGNFNSYHDRSRLSYRENKKLIKAGEEKYGDYADDRYASKSALEEMQDKIKDEAVNTDAAPAASPVLSEANKGLSEYESGLGSFGNSIFGGDDLSQATAEASTITGGSSAAAQGYLNDYASNVAGGLSLSGVRTRGPQSGIRPGEGF